jgi:hypothetical protein
MTHGLLAEFESPEALLAAARHLREAGLTRLTAFTPFPVEGLDEVLELRRTRIPLAVLLIGLAGGSLAFLFQYWANGLDYPLDVGGRPLFSWPTFVPITFETVVLFGSFAAFFGLLAASRLPRLWQPIFEVEGFERATIDRFFLGVDAADPRYRPDRLAALLPRLGALRVAAVPARHP